MKRSRVLGVFALLSLFLCWAAPAAANELNSSKVRALAKEAYIWGYALVDDHRIQYSYFVDKNSPEFKADWNKTGHNRRLYTPADTTIQTINADTLYSFIGIDVRDEPIVITVPQVAQERYYGVSLFDLWGHSFDMIGTRTTGNEAGRFMIVGPNWEGPKPEGIKKVIRMETTLGSAAFRTQLFNADDLENVKQVQDGYQVQLLSAYLGNPPSPRTPVEFVKPLTRDEQRSSLVFFSLLNNLLQFAPTHPTEVELKQRLAQIGIGEGLPFDASKLSPEMKAAFEQGVADAWLEIESTMQKIDSGEVLIGSCAGTREYLKNNYLYRTTGIALGGNGQPKEEVVYQFITLDNEGKKLDASNKYTIRFGPDAMPPAKQFWSMTMYNLPGRLLVENPINRYLLNTPMQSQWVRDADGGLTFYIQKDSPGQDKENNWLPAPQQGEFYMVMRLYLPSKDAQDGIWKAPRPKLVM